MHDITPLKCIKSRIENSDLDLLVDDAYASPTVTAFVPKDEAEVKHIKSTLKSQFNITIAGGQGKLKR